MQELRDLTPPSIPFDPVSDVTGQFTLESGRDVLEAYFPDVQLLRMPNELLVTEAAPLVAYMLSRSSLQAPNHQIDDGQRRVLQEHVEAQMRAQGGTYRITKDVGMFVATKPRSGVKTT
jgi:hypothetical protein